MINILRFLFQIISCYLEMLQSGSVTHRLIACAALDVMKVSVHHEV